MRKFSIEEDDMSVANAEANGASTTAADAVVAAESHGKELGANAAVEDDSGVDKATLR